MKKGGQFYLVASMIILVILAGFISLSNYTSKVKFSEMKNIKQEINTEVENVLDYGTINNLASNEFLALFNNLSSNYIEKFSEKTTIFLYGESPGTIVCKGKNSWNETLSIDYGSGQEIVKNGEGEFEEIYTSSSASVNLTLDLVSYEFEFQEGEGFYYLISNKYGGENDIIRN